MKFYLAIQPDIEIFEAEVVSTPSDPYMTISLVDGVTGSFGAPLLGQTVVFSRDGVQIGEDLRLKAWSLSSITVSENDTTTPNILPGDIVEIYNQFHLFPKFPRFVQNGENVTIFQDYDETFSFQTNTYRPQAVTGPPAFAKLESNGQAQIRFVGDRSQALSPGATIISYLWTAYNSLEGTSTSQGTEASPVIFTWTQLGWHLVSLSVTDSNGIGATQYTYVLIDNLDNPEFIIEKFDTYSDSFDFEQGGGECGFTIIGRDAGPGIMPNDALVMHIAEGDITTPTASWPFRTNILFAGYILSDTIRQNPDYGDVTFRAATITALMRNLKMFPASLSDAATATNWTQAKSLTVDRALSYLYKYQSTLSIMTPIIYSGYSALVRRQDFGPSDLYSQVQNDLVSSILGKVVSTQQGVLYHVIDYNVQLTAERATATTRKTLQKGIWVNDVGIEETGMYIQNVSQVKMSGVYYPGGQIDDLCPAFSEAPGDAPRVYGRESNFDRLILTSQADLNVRCGLMLAKLTKTFDPFRIQFINDGSFGIVPQDLFPTTIETDDNTRELDFTGNLIPRRFNRTYNHELGFFSVNVDFEPVTTGPAGITVDMPCGPPDQELPPSIQPQSPSGLQVNSSLVLGTTGSSHYFEPAVGQTWQRRVMGLVNTSVLDLIPDPWSTFKQGYNPERVILWSSGKGFLARSTDSGKKWVDRSLYLEPPPSWPNETGTALSSMDMMRIQGDIFDENRLYILAKWQYTGAYHGAVGITDNGFDYDWYNLTGSTQVRPLGMAVDKGNGQSLYVTTWENNPTGTIYLRRHDTSTMAQLNKASLGVAGLFEIDAKKWYVTPFTRNMQTCELWLYGRMQTPQGLSNVQIIKSTNCGLTGSYSTIESSWLGDIAGSFGVDDDSNFYGVRNRWLNFADEVDLSFSPNNDQFDVCKAGPNKAVVIYPGSANTIAFAIAVDHLGNVTKGSEVVLRTGTATQTGVAYLQDDAVISTYAISGQGYTRVLTLSGLTINTNTETNPNTANLSRVCAISPTRAIWVYRAVGALRGKVLDISGTTVTVNALVTIVSSGNTGEILDIVSKGNDAVVSYEPTVGGAARARLLFNITTTFSVSAELTVDAGGFDPAIYSEGDYVLIGFYTLGNNINIAKVVRDGNALRVESVSAISHIIGGDVPKMAMLSLYNQGGVGVAQSSSDAGVFLQYTNYNNNAALTGNKFTFDSVSNIWDFRSAKLQDNLGVFIAHSTDSYAIVATPGNATFYQGLNTLTSKFDMPFMGIEPQAMSLSNNNIAIAGNAPSGIPVIYSPSPYSDDISNFPGLSSGTVSTVIKWV